MKIPQKKLIAIFCAFGVFVFAFSLWAAEELPNPLGEGVVDPAVILGNIINAALGIVGSLALAVFVYGGFMWVTSAGNDEKIKKGKDMIMWASLGLALIFASYAIVTFVIRGIVGSTGAGGSGGETTGTGPKPEGEAPK